MADEWFPLRAALHDHPKFDDLGMDAIGLWLLCRARVADRGTGGFVTTAEVRQQARRHGQLADLDHLTAELVTAGLWEPADDGWMFHDFDEHCGPIEARRAAARERQRRHRASQPVTQRHATSRDNGVTERDPLKESESESESDKSPTETLHPSVKPKRSSPLIDELAQTYRAGCAARGVTATDLPALRGQAGKLLRAKVAPDVIRQAVLRLVERNKNATLLTHLVREIEGERNRAVTVAAPASAMERIAASTNPIDRDIAAILGGRS